MKLIIIGLSLLLSTTVNAMSFEHAEAIYQRLVKTNHIWFAPKLVLSNSSEINAENRGYTIAIYKGMLKWVRNDAEMAFVLGHELGHSYDGNRDSELAADSYGAKVIIRAGYNKCMGARVLARLHDKGDSVHPPSDYRVQHLGC